MVSGERKGDGIKNEPYSWEIHLFATLTLYCSTWDSLVS